MEFVKLESQNRRDIYYMAKCQNCGNVEKTISDDEYYWKEIFPKMKCKKCNESTESMILPQDYKILTPVPKYKEHEII